MRLFWTGFIIIVGTLFALSVLPYVDIQSAPFIAIGLVLMFGFGGCAFVVGLIRISKIQKN